MDLSEIIIIIKNLSEKVDQLYKGIRQQQEPQMAQEVVTSNFTVKNYGEKSQSDDAIEIADIMRILVLDLASVIAKNKVENFYKTMELPERAS
ncbi:hypothetical protein AYI68_g8287 [Smittium mucronatum]|uniref:Uncharacterized protein n=1 Tax=Smittium mucronatum TaxID=133383 RepID=A0A1R0GLB6_9FUNG|nr:hypothetical protein AYI68_g8287 [Smittium mucronatum]